MKTRRRVSLQKIVMASSSAFVGKKIWDSSGRQCCHLREGGGGDGGHCTNSKNVDVGRVIQNNGNYALMYSCV